MVHTAIFFGAGASKAEGAPLQDELFRDYFSSPSFKNSTELMDQELTAFFWDMFHLDVKRGKIAEMNFPTFEEVLGLTDLAIMHKEAFRHFQVMSNELSTPKILICPADVRRAANDFGTAFGNTNISYFINLDANEVNPQMMLSGDDNFEIGGTATESGRLEFSTKSSVTWSPVRHKFVGNIAITDGSVQQITTEGLQQVFQDAGAATNRILIP